MCYKGYKHTEETKEKMRSATKGSKNHFYGKHHTKETKIKLKKRFKGVSYDGGYSLKKIPRYDLYATQIEYAEKIRRNEEDPNILEVTCTKCGVWFIPTADAIKHRIQSLAGRNYGEAHLYCSEKHKKECPIFWKKLYSDDQEKPDHSREVQSQLAAMVLERDEYTCIKCGSKEKLECHHIEGIHHEPMESADMDVCVTFCEICHDAAHKEKGCTYDDMKCKIEDREIFVPPIDKTI
jgi:hypothetical protein